MKARLAGRTKILREDDDLYIFVLRRKIEIDNKISVAYPFILESMDHLPRDALAKNAFRLASDY
jgi:hypothetical protein